MKCGLICLLIFTTTGIYLGILMRRPVSELTESLECPFCYGTDLCKDVEAKRINLRYETLSDFFHNILSVKNVYQAEYNDRRVVLKKLGHQDELTHIDSSQDFILNFMTNARSFKPCGTEDFERFINSVNDSFGLEQISTILQVNVEPLMLALLDADWPVPRLYGSCGSIVAEEYCGTSLNSFQEFPWNVRALLALQLLEAALNFTHKHNDFRLYLTDISPDNIAVDDDLNVRFVDLENVILKLKDEVSDESVHYSEYFSDEGFVYSEDEVCGSSISDHNVYAVCRLLLSSRAPWPMMPDGLLHSAPGVVLERFGELFELVELCVDSVEKLDRFDLARKIIEMLKVAVK